MTLKLSDGDWLEAFHRSGRNFTKMADMTGMNLRNIMDRRLSLEKKLGVLLEPVGGGKAGRQKAHVTKINHRIVEDVKGIVIVFSDGHFWPGERSVAFDAVVKLTTRLKPAMVVCNGDAVDGARISRHPPGGWAEMPSVADELAAVQERLGEIEASAPDSCKLIWPAGNHDSRFTSRLAQNAPEYMRVKGTDIADHFPAWNFCWSLFLNGNTVIKHRWHNGVHGAYNNVLKSGKTIITGHTHRLQSIQFGDYNGLRFGVECGTVSECGPENDKFSYSEDAPHNWSQGFVVLTYDEQGRLLDPEICRVLHGQAWFRGEVVS